MEPFLGQIQAFGFNFAPQGWAKCDGQLLPISQHTALFSLLGTFYGGDGESTFALPDLRGRVSLHHGNGPGLTPRQIGARGGQERVTLNTNEMPSHKHTASGSNEEADAVDPGGRVPATTSTGIYSATPNEAMNANIIGNTGGGQPHENMEPYLVINWCIALVGVYPSQS